MGLIQHKRQAVELSAGEAYERLPAVTDGLIATFPMDGSGVGIDIGTNITETDGVWDISGSGSVGNFSQNGDTSENSRNIEKNQHRTESKVWRTNSI